MKTLLAAAVLLFAPIAAHAAAPDFGGMDGIAQATADETSMSLDERGFLKRSNEGPRRMRRLTLAQLPAASPTPSSDAPAAVVPAPALPPVLLGSPSRLNLNLPLNAGALLMRDGANGMWRAGGYIDPLGISYGATEYAEIGVAQSWTANHGYPGIGAHLGLSAGSLINVAQQAVSGYDLVSLWKPLGTVSNWVRFNADYQHLQEAPGAGGKKDIWGVGVDVNVPVSVVMGWLQTGL